jgi:ABC-2 type transport system permease protein
MGAVFLLIGMMNPITAKITPQLLKSLMPEGINITITEPTALDSWVQFFKNVPQMGLIVLVIIFSGIMANEFSRGTLINILTKGLHRSTVILSKYTVAALLWTFSYLLCFGVCYAYTVYFWKNDTVENLVLSVFCLWLFGLLLLSVIMLGGVLFRSSYGCLLFTGAFVAVLFLIDIVPKFQKYNPVSLASSNLALLTKDIAAADMRVPAIISLVIIIAAITASMDVFNRKKV